MVFCENISFRMLKLQKMMDNFVQLQKELVMEEKVYIKNGILAIWYCCVQ